MQMQIQHFRQALERAITGGLDRFYVIHGLGKGKLREEISRILPEYSQVKSFNNNFHPRYGFGATEIFLK
jgi:dsDNA-specific endonuclease/ATPase MutS2